MDLSLLLSQVKDPAVVALGGWIIYELRAMRRQLAAQGVKLSRVDGAVYRNDRRIAILEDRAGRPA